MNMKRMFAFAVAILAFGVSAVTEQHDDLGLPKVDDDFWKPSGRGVMMVDRVASSARSIDTVVRNDSASAPCSSFDSRDGTYRLSQSRLISTGRPVGIHLIFR